MKEGLCVKAVALAFVSGLERCSSLYGAVSVGGDQLVEAAPVAQFLTGRQAATGVRAPAGANGWSLLSMCQIASVRRRPISIADPRDDRPVLGVAAGGVGGFD
jgi:hypothetical protein